MRSRREGQRLRQRVVVHAGSRVRHQRRTRPGGYLDAELLVVDQRAARQADRVARRRAFGDGRVARQIDHQQGGIEDRRIDGTGGRIDLEAFEIAARDGFDPDVVELAALGQLVEQGLDREGLAGLARRYRDRRDTGEIDTVLSDAAVLESHHHGGLTRALQGHGVGSGNVALTHGIRPDDADLGQILIVDHRDGRRLIDVELVVAAAIGTRDANVDHFPTLDIGIIRSNAHLDQPAASPDRDRDALAIAQADDQIGATGRRIDGRIQADPGAFDHIAAIEEHQASVLPQRLTTVVELDVAQGDQVCCDRLGAQRHILDRGRRAQRVLVGQRLDSLDDAQQAHEAAAAARVTTGRQTGGRGLKCGKRVCPELQRLQHGCRRRRLDRRLLCRGRGISQHQTVVHAHALFGCDGQNLTVCHLQFDARASQRAQGLAVLDDITDLEDTRLAVKADHDDLSGDSDYFCDLGHGNSPI